MALVTETVNIDGNDFTHVYSNDNRYVVQTDTGINNYYEVYDPIDNPLNHNYEEGEPIPDVEPSEEDYAEVGRIMMGVGTDE